MGLETISYAGPQLWNLVPQEIKESVCFPQEIKESEFGMFLIFKYKIKNGTVQNVHADSVALFSSILVLCKKYFDSWLSYKTVNVEA